MPETDLLGHPVESEADADVRWAATNLVELKEKQAILKDEIEQAEKKLITMMQEKNVSRAVARGKTVTLSTNLPKTKVVIKNGVDKT